MIAKAGCGPHNVTEMGQIPQALVPRYQSLRDHETGRYSTGISLLIRDRSMPWRLRMMRAPT